MPPTALRLGELVATFALAQDNAFGQPLESQLRSCLLASWLGEETGYAPALRATLYWVALLRYLGCTGHAHEVATVFGDEIAIRAQTLVHDAANPAEVMHDVITFATAGHPPEQHDAIVEALHAGVQEWIVRNFSSGCEVGDMLAARLEMGEDVRDALRYTFERWNGHGFPNGVSGTAIPSPCAWSISRTTWKPSGACSRRRRRLQRRRTAATARTIRNSPISSLRTARAGSSASPRWNPGMPCSTSSRSRADCCAALRSTARSKSPPTSSI